MLLGVYRNLLAQSENVRLMGEVEQADLTLLVTRARHYTSSYKRLFLRIIIEQFETI